MWKLPGGKHATSGRSATLLIFAGLPGSGKSTLAKLVAGRLGATYLRIDTIEQGIRDLLNFDVEAEGYRLAYRVAADNLAIGQIVVADSCNPIALSRREWQQVALGAGVPYFDIEVCCSDTLEHKKRIESRSSEVPGLELPSWVDVQAREYDAWTEPRIVIDTAGRSESESLRELLEQLEQRGLGA